jgi:hypothetical protein
MALTHAQLDVAVELFDVPPQLLDPVCVFFDPPGQIADLGFEPVHAKLGVNRGGPVRGVERDRSATVDVALQHIQIAFETIEPLVRRAVLRPSRRRAER